jgi:hypothetical protein
MHDMKSSLSLWRARSVRCRGFGGGLGREGLPRANAVVLNVDRSANKAL